MNIALGLGRMTRLKNLLARGGMLSLAVGLAALFAVGGSWLQIFANLLLVFGTLVWLVSRARSLETFFRYKPDEAIRTADGTTFGIYLVIRVSGLPFAGHLYPGVEAMAALTGAISLCPLSLTYVKIKESELRAKPPQASRGEVARKKRMKEVP